MTTAQDTSTQSRTLKDKAIDEAKKAFLLTLYFGTWFCALAFLGVAALDERPIPLEVFGIAIIKAGISAKFLLIAQAIFPMKVNSNHGVIRSMLLESFVYLFIVLVLNYLEAGVEGLFHGKAFFESMLSFGQRNPLHVLAMSIVYWLIVWPYLVLIGMRLQLGSTATLRILFGYK
jgi:hypothetical protein